MAVLAGIAGALAGLGLGIVLAEIVFPSEAGWHDVVPVVLAVTGWLTARELLRRHRSRKTPAGPRPAGA